MIVTAGANQALVSLMLTLLDPIDRAVLFRPYYFNTLMAIQARAAPRWVRVRACQRRRCGPASARHGGTWVRRVTERLVEPARARV